ncbi:hypothetical protein ACFQBQ_00990 [Granulicella cerasi]|uniref:Alpha-L-rhamnosidase six-hairpin glycosidase domain-containing protein n=1 Tax=Granulicella cerasi TaxID=741063 RepID=A0ABW1Z435_9BACT
MKRLNRREALQGVAGSLVLGSLTPNALAAALQTAATPAAAKPPMDARHAAFLAKAQALIPQLNEAILKPVAMVEPVADEKEYQRWRMPVSGTVADAEARLMQHGDAVTLDFGRHMTGYFSFDIEGVGLNIDSPARLELRFGEVPGDIAEPFYPYHGSLSESWLPIDSVDIENLPQTHKIERRHAFRWVQIKVVSNSNAYKVRLKNFRAKAITAAKKTPPPAPASAPEMLRRIDEVSLATLRDCMLTVFEDGPRRDQRLWLGDLRVQALVNYVSFQNYELVKRSIYLLAAFPEDSGLLRACVFEKPEPHRSNNTILDYAALFVPTLLEYAHASGDVATAKDLYPVAKLQLELLSKNVNAEGLFVDPKNIWIFIDWRKDLDKTGCVQGVMIYSYRKAIELAKLTGHHEDIAGYEERIRLMTDAAVKNFWDKEQRVFVSGPKRQVSWATQAWLGLAEVVSKEDGAHALLTATQSPDAIPPAAPYLYHYVTEAMILGARRTPR